MRGNAISLLVYICLTLVNLKECVCVCVYVCLSTSFSPSRFTKEQQDGFVRDKGLILRQNLETICMQSDLKSNTVIVYKGKTMLF